jgi:membrane protease YdiL (CAAX protease family)
MTSIDWGAAPTAAGGHRTKITAWAVLVWACVGLGLELAGAPRVLLLLLLAPVLEEATFRAGLHEALLTHGWSPAKAVVLTAVAFAALHVLVQGSWQGALVLLPALLIGMAYNRWRSVRWCVLLHAAMNAVWLLVTLLNRAA